MKQYYRLPFKPSVPTQLASKLLSRGYESAGAWDSVVMRGAEPGLWEPHASGCELFTSQNSAEWRGFLLKCYGMPPDIGDWLNAPVGRKGWFHVLRRENGQSGAALTMARGLYLAEDGWAWLGIDAPVPAVMAPCFDDDQKVTARLLMAATPAGAHSFVSDFEVPSPTRAGPGYQRWGELGFSPVYLRKLHSKG